MKRFISLILLTVILLCACTTEKPNETAAVTGDTTASQISNPAETNSETTAADTTAADTTDAITAEPVISGCEDYDLRKYIIPYWQGNAVYNESVLPLLKEDGSIDDISLLFYADEIVEVRSSSLKTLYTEGKDYTLVDGKLHIVKGGSIPLISFDKVYLKDAVAGQEGFICDNGYYMQYMENATRHNQQIAVTYKHSDKWTGDIQLSGSELLPETFKKLNAGSDLNVLLYGDSIGNGSNATSLLKVYTDPYMPTWYDMLTEALGAMYKSKVKLTNISQDGMASAAAVSKYSSLKPEGKFDLIIIAFGMNDASGAVPAATFAKNVRKLIDKFGADNPGCEFILVAPILPNIEMPNFYHPGNPSDSEDVNNYGDSLLAKQEKGVAAIDVTSFHSYMLEHKRYIDMSGNNINHPNDFLIRLYAQSLVCLLSDGENIDLSDYVYVEPEPYSSAWTLGGGWIDNFDGTYTYTNAGDKNGYMMYTPSDGEAAYEKYRATYKIQVIADSWAGDTSRGFGPVIVSAPNKELSIVNQTSGGAYITGANVNYEGNPKLTTKPVKANKTYELSVTVDRNTGEVEYFLDGESVTSFTVTDEALDVSAGVRNQYAGTIKLVGFELTEIK